jgi:DNA-binding FadR family transcriptional regulator
MPRLIARSSLPREVFDQLATEIVDGEVEPGAALPSERELAETLGVNRGAVREGLTRLAQAGLIAVRHGGATRVLDYRHSGGLDLLPRLLVRSDGRLDPSVARAIVEMRAALGPDVARLAAARAPGGLVASLDAVTAAMAGARGDVETLQGLALEFWEHLVEACGNVAYRLAFNSLRTAYDPVRPLLVHVLGDEVRDTEGYAALAAAVARRDARAAEDAARRLLGKGTRAMGARLAALTGASRS